MKKLGNIMCVISMAIAVWMVVSFAEINSKNLKSGSEYSPANFFTITLDLFSSNN